MPNRFHMLGNVFLLPHDQGRIHHGVHRQVPLAANEPCCCVVHAAQGGKRERPGVNAEFELLAVAALQDVEVQAHTVK